MSVIRLTHSLKLMVVRLQLPWAKKMFEVKAEGGPKAGKKVRPNKHILSMVDWVSNCKPDDPAGPILYLNPNNEKRNSQLSESLISSSKGIQIVSNSFSGGNVLCYDNISDTDMVQRNHRFWEHLQFNVGEKLADLITKFDVLACGGVKDIRSKILELENGDTSKQEGGKVFVNRDL